MRLSTIITLPAKPVRMCRKQTYEHQHKVVRNIVEGSFHLVFFLKTRVQFGQVLSVFEFADEVAATEAMADADQHPLLSELEHVRAGNIFAL